ncbi:uncharacterized protein EI97DRAFT_110136 [Westerdykella ornata]|uniref:Uncharacterized protein n=1 Tax=Westerdykella ornata TaxID=318751 RepID=A0A6A6JUL7_WESOR|nr:uncharacterized protein EI97DRAFT_110136 [Westerdykella ornata]KAF2280077.1 hypothetical protein EI97DRAFT_110136 [Westerdykella ornata]
MQSAASRRALSYLASKLHPQLPLSPRESAQLLAILTTSFRAHLDRAHPLVPPEGTPEDNEARRQHHAGSRNSISSHGDSSHLAAREHIQSILTNPLFAVNPQRRSSERTKTDAQSVLRDPLGWFLDQVALGLADLPKAAMCLQMLHKMPRDATRTDSSCRASDSPRPAFHIAQWLQSSGMDRSPEFLCYDVNRLLRPLVGRLLGEGEIAIVWGWLTRHPRQRVEETGLEEEKVRAFRRSLLSTMVTAESTISQYIDEALSIFLRAGKMRSNHEALLDRKTLQPAGFLLVNRILKHPSTVKSPEVYEEFLRYVPKWTTSQSRSVQGALWLYHPHSATPGPAIAYIKDPKGMASELQYAWAGRRKFFVHLCLEAARQCLKEQSFADAQFALEFARDTFPELVNTKSSSSVACDDVRVEAEERLRNEDKNLEMIDRLLPTA